MSPNHSPFETRIASAERESGMATEDQRTIENYMDGFRESDHAKVLSCLTDDVEWVIPGAFHLVGKQAFDGEIENPAFVGSPTIEIKRVVEESDVVVAEGAVHARKADGGDLHAVFCDVFVMRGGLIRHLTLYLMELK
jgi:ketosteroid isomerase-like protein